MFPPMYKNNIIYIDIYLYINRKVHIKLEAIVLTTTSYAPGSKRKLQNSKPSTSPDEGQTQNSLNKV